MRGGREYYIGPILSLLGGGLIISKTDAAILGMLTVEPMSGYDMKKFSERSLAHFWHESYGNLYPRLKRLASEGLVEGRRDARPNAPDAIVYSLTEAGRRRFREWLEEAPEPERVRNELLLKVFFGAHAAPEVTRARIEAHRAEQVERLEHYRTVGQGSGDEEGTRPEALFWWMSLRRGVVLTEARIRWCDECLRILDSLGGEDER